MAPPRRLLLLLLLLLALVLGLFRVDGFVVGAAGKGRFGGQRVRLAAAASQPDEPLGGLRPRGRLLRPFPASRRPALAASVLLATCLSLNTLQPCRVQAADPSFSTVVLAASSPTPPSALGPYQATLDDLANRLDRLEFRMDESDKSRKQEAAEAEKRFDAKMAAMEKTRKQEAAEAEKRFDAKMAAMEERFDAKMAAMEKTRKQEAAEAEKRFDAKMAAMEARIKTGGIINFFVSLTSVGSAVSAWTAVAAIKAQK